MKDRRGWRWFLCFSVLWAVGCSREPQIEGRKAGEWISQLRNSDWSARNRASDVLAREGTKSLPYLVQFLRAEDPGMRRTVVSTIGKMGELARPEAPVLLRRMAVEPEGVIRAEILKALTAIDPQGPEVAAELTKRLRDESPEVREAAQSALLALANALKPPPSAASGGAQAAAASSPAEDQKELGLLREAVSAQQKGAPFGLTAAVLRDGLRAALVWNGLKPGTREPLPIRALIFEKDGAGAYRFLKEVSELSQLDGSERLATALGGADRQRLVRSCGVPRDKLVGLLGEQARAFESALLAKKGEQALAAYEELTRAFSFRLNVFQELLPRLLAERSLVEPGWKFSMPPEGDTVPVEISSRGVSTKGQLRVEPCGQGLVIAEVKEGA